MERPKNGKPAPAPRQRPAPPPKPPSKPTRQPPDDPPTTDISTHEPARYENLKIVLSKVESGPASLDDETDQWGNSGYGDSLTAPDPYRYSSSSCDSVFASAGQSHASGSKDGNILVNLKSMLQSRQPGSRTSLVSGTSSSSGRGSDTEDDLDEMGWPSDEFSDSEFEQELYGNQVIKSAFV